MSEQLDGRFLHLRDLYLVESFDKAEALGASLRDLYPHNRDLLEVLTDGEIGRGRYDLASEYARSSLALEPNHSGTLTKLGEILELNGQLTKAYMLYQSAFVADPAHMPAYIGTVRVAVRGGLLKEVCRFLASSDLPSYQIAISYFQLISEDGRTFHDGVRGLCEMTPLYADYFVELARYLTRRKDFSHALSVMEAVLGCSENTNELLLIASSMAYTVGEVELAWEWNEKALAQSPDDEHLLFGRVGLMIRSPLFSHDDIKAELLSIRSRREEEIAAAAHQYQRVPPKKKDGPLHVGYAAHRIHWMFLEPVLRSHDPDRVKVFLYTNDHRCDTYARGIERQPLTLEDPDALAEVIRSDELDVLVEMDCSGKLLQVLSKRPSPIQLSWLGTHHSSYLPWIDGLIADPIIIPPSQRCYYSERIVEMPVWAPFSLPGYVPAENGPLPADTDNRVTFGVCNRAEKFNDACISSWIAILHRVAGSRLCIKDRMFADSFYCEKMRGRFIFAGIAGDRIELLDWSNHPTYFKYYHTIDITLDTFPKNGGIMTLESLWMGVPVITLVGDRFTSRLAAPYVNELGYEQWIAKSADEYVEKAVALAHDLKQVREFRESSREKMKASIIMDGVRYTNLLEGQYEALVRERLV